MEEYDDSNSLIGKVSDAFSIILVVFGICLIFIRALSLLINGQEAQRIFAIGAFVMILMVVGPFLLGIIEFLFKKGK